MSWPQALMCIRVNWPNVLKCAIQGSTLRNNSDVQRSGAPGNSMQALGIHFEELWAKWYLKFPLWDSGTLKHSTVPIFNNPRSEEVEDMVQPSCLTFSSVGSFPWSWSQLWGSAKISRWRLQSGCSFTKGDQINVKASSCCPAVVSAFPLLLEEENCVIVSMPSCQCTGFHDSREAMKASLSRTKELKATLLENKQWFQESPGNWSLGFWFIHPHSKRLQEGEDMGSTEGGVVL